MQAGGLEHLLDLICDGALDALCFPECSIIVPFSVPLQALRPGYCAPLGPSAQSAPVTAGVGLSLGEGCQTPAVCAGPLDIAVAQER